MDFDWGRHHVFYHGWNRSGWVNNARPYVHIPNVYVQGSRPYISQTWRHNPSHGDPGRYLASRPVGVPGGRYPHTTEVRGRGSTPTGPPGGMLVPRTNTQQFSNRGKESLRTVSPRPTPQVPAISQRPVTVHIQIEICRTINCRLQLSVRDRCLRLQLSANDRHLRLLLSARDRRLKLHLSLVVTGDPMRSKRRAPVARLAARAMSEGRLYQLQ